MNNDIFINKKIWKDFSEKQMNEFQQNVFNFYREKGFPYFPTEENFRINEFKKLRNYDFKRVIDHENKVINQTMHGLSLAWSYMPHSWKIVCSDKKTPFEVFHNDYDFLKVIQKRIKMGDNISDNGIRKMLKIFSNTQSVSNFRPTAAAAIYSLFCEKGGLVWDMSSGFGGRLLGATIAGVNYIGTEPSSLTYDGLLNISKEFSKPIIDSKIYKSGSEDFIPDENSLDFAFTSPPYYNLEKYSNEETQSYIKFPDKESWLHGYLKKTFSNCHIGLKNGRYMAINIANTKNFKNLEEETIKMAELSGFTLVDTWKLALSNPTMKNKTCSFKYEPIFLFKKE